MLKRYSLACSYYLNIEILNIELSFILVYFEILHVILLYILSIIQIILYPYICYNVHLFYVIVSNIKFMFNITLCNFLRAGMKYYRSAIIQSFDTKISMLLTIHT